MMCACEKTQRVVFRIAQKAKHAAVMTGEIAVNFVVFTFLACCSMCNKYPL